MIGFAAVFLVSRLFISIRGKCYHFNDGMDSDKIFPTDLLLLHLQVLFELHGTEQYIEKQLQQSIH